MLLPDVIKTIETNAELFSIENKLLYFQTNYFFFSFIKRISVKLTTQGFCIFKQKVLSFPSVSVTTDQYLH